MSGFVFREALLGDREAVLGIRDVYHGCDYLHHRYEEYQTSSHISSYLCECNGEMVGFVSMITVDDGETVVDRAARVRSDYEGKGVYRYMLSEVDKLLVKQGKVKRHAVVTTYPMNDPKAQPIMERAMSKYTFSIKPGAENMEQVFGPSSNIHVSEELPRITMDPRYTSYLFPENRIIVEYMPYRSLETNIPLLSKSTFTSTLKETADGKTTGLLLVFNASLHAMSKYTFMIDPGASENMKQFLGSSTSIQISKELPEIAMDLRFTSYLFPKNRVLVDWVPYRLLESNIPILPKSMFASTLKETKVGKITGLLSAFSAFRGTDEYDVVGNLDVFGTDLDTLEKHVAVHLKHLHETEKGFVFIRICYEQNAESEVFDKTLRNFGTEKIGSGPLADTTMYLYERLL